MPGKELAFLGEANADGFLAWISSQPLQATSLDAAEREFVPRIREVLSMWSTELNIPLSIFQTEVKEIATGSQRADFTVPYSPAPFAAARRGLVISPAFRGFAGLYREALNSGSHVYQFLCLFKIIEGIRKRRDAAERASREQGNATSVHRSTYRRTPRNAQRGLIHYSS